MKSCTTGLTARFFNVTIPIGLRPVANSIEVRGATLSGDYGALAAELVARPVDIIIGVNSAATNAARKATSTIPIVMTAVNDPVEWGFVKSLERPGTNVTGTTLNAPQLVGRAIAYPQAPCPEARPDIDARRRQQCGQSTAVCIADR
jgi:ABC transporter substrate binding protein